MVTAVSSDDAIISRSSFNLHNLSGLLSALASCISRFRTANTGFNPKIDTFLSNIEKEIELKITELIFLLKVPDVPNTESLNARDDVLLANQDVDSILEDAVDEIHADLDADIYRANTNPTARSIELRSGNETTNEAFD